ncbi:MAG: AAA family ATPase [Anaerolineales bacterium]|nr:AAA family ATPase [Anaerolineales bacterium]
MPRQAPKLHLSFLGPPEVRLGAQTLSFPTRKTLALLTYLALEAGEQSREHLAALLWPESSPARGYASLRNTLGRLQKALHRAGGPVPSSFLSITHTALALNRGADVDLDLKIVEQAYILARADRSSRVPPDGAVSLPALLSALACHRGDFLAGFSLGDAPAFDDWAGLQREAWRRRLGLILDRLSEIQFARGEFANTAETVSHWLRLDGLNEVACRRKMRAHFAAGERGQALETYTACRTLLAAELRVEPEPDTEALAARIRTQHTMPASPPRSPPPATPLNFLENLFAGRGPEQQALSEHYHRAAAGQPQLVVLRGEAGIGKTRLATTFLAWARAQGAVVLKGGAFESGLHIPFQPWVEMLRAELEREAAPRDWLEAAWLSPLAQLLPELRERSSAGPWNPAEPVLPTSPASQTQLFEALTGFTLALAGRAALVMFLDDLQWADSATLAALQYALWRWRASATPILVLVSLRSEALQPPAGRQRFSLSAWLAQVAREVEPYHLELEPLGESETMQLVLSLLAPPAPDFAQWVFNETRGHPFYLMETLKDLLERGALHPQRQPAGQWTFRVDAEHDLGRAVRVPSTVRAVIRSRLSRLSPGAFTLLAAGTVLDHDLTFERLCAVANLTPELGLPALDEVLSSRLLREVRQAGSASVYAFANDMIREVVYTEAGDARRQLLHERTLIALSAGHDSAAILAHHALAAGVVQSAFAYSLAAAHEALNVLAVGEAKAHLETARHLALEVVSAGAEMEAQLRDLYAQLGQAHVLNGLPEQAAAVDAERPRPTPSSLHPEA